MKKLIASVGNVSILCKPYSSLGDKEAREYARLNSQIHIPATELGTFEIRVRFPRLEQDSAAFHIHLFQLDGKKYVKNRKVVVFAGQTEFTIIPTDEGFFTCQFDHTPMMPEMISICTEDADLTSVFVDVYLLDQEGTSGFLSPYTMD